MSRHQQLPASFLSLIESGRRSTSAPGHCGYCDNKREGDTKFAFSVQTLTVLDYQALVDRGWRRSGDYVYRSELRDTCCPLLTIRLNADSHKKNLTSSQRKMLRRFNSFLQNGEPDLLSKPHASQASEATNIGKKDYPDENMERDSIKEEVGDEFFNIEVALSLFLLDAAKTCFGESVVKSLIRSQKLVKRIQRDGFFERTFKDAEMDVKQLIDLPTTGVYSSPVSLQLQSRKDSSSTPQETAKVLCDNILSSLSSHEGIKSGDFEILKILPSTSGHINILVKESVKEPTLVKKEVKDNNTRKSNGSTKGVKTSGSSYGGDEDNLMDSSSTSSSTVKTGHKFTVTMVPATFNKVAYELYKEYQRVVHSDTRNTPDSYTDFLCSSPLIPLPRTGPVLLESEDAKYDPLIASARASIRSSWKNGEGSGAGLPLLSSIVKGGIDNGVKDNIVEREEEEDSTLRFVFNPALDGSDLRNGYGSFHLHYKIDNVLVAVGVVDILPLCLSSVYLFYNPHLPRLELGKLTALYEIQWVQQVSKFAPRLSYWYAGLYVHKCPKMLYKRQFEPSELLCPISRKWTYITKAVLDKLDKEKVPLIATAEEETKAKTIEEVNEIVDACMKRSEALIKLEAGSAAACSIKIPMLVNDFNGMWEPSVWRDLFLELRVPEGAKVSLKQAGQKALFALSERIGPDLMKRVVVSPTFLRMR